jgi:hypothetical protein
MVNFNKYPLPKEIVDIFIKVPQYLESEMRPAQNVGPHLLQLGPE